MPKPAADKRHDPKAEARLGIFWLVDGKLLIESAPLSECEQYGDHLNYQGSHIRVWERWQEFGKAPAETEHEEYARGRVMSDSKTKRFTLLADRCILKRKELIAAIKERIASAQANLAGDRPSLSVLPLSPRRRARGGVADCRSQFPNRNTWQACSASSGSYLLVHQPEIAGGKDASDFALMDKGDKLASWRSSFFRAVS